ncbi:hypothetical protein MIMGU_mgv1a021400mg [Erythranthe guttata]|uniref:Transcription factor CBF/NF-Y/archaeal histone domain-containing protein n=1 Tax=Erythranthe guttata TaxID=4155 RepID=A0A022QJW4_ERYGU|nr:hypothetical protein MIMGU_mgv1a021400mg [Erythranthe guttata]
MSDEIELSLPIANVGRMMKKILPPSAKISREAKERMQQCASEFICFVTGEAAHRYDICWALSSLGFDNYSEAMLRYLQNFRGFERERANQNNKANNSCSDEKDEEISYGDDNTTSTPSFDFGILERGETSTAN